MEKFTSRVHLVNRDGCLQVASPRLRLGRPKLKSETFLFEFRKRFIFTNKLNSVTPVVYVLYAVCYSFGVLF